MEEHLKQLLGKKIVGIVKDTESVDADTVWGLTLEGGTTVWILRDPEGNGPGFLDIEEE